MAEILLTYEGITESAAQNAAAQAKAALLCSRIYTLRKLHVEPAGESIVLRGRVESFYHKQLAQELVRTAIEGVEVVNVIQVVYSRERSLTESDCYLP
jgi:hypothetical protein